MTPDIVDAINMIYDGRVPKNWCYDPTGVEISWLTPSLMSWISGLINRHYQLTNWVFKERPMSYWLTGFFNPQGFLTAVKQEITRQKVAENWSLDKVDYEFKPTKEIVATEDGRIEGKTLPALATGVYIHGMVLEGAGWDKGKYALDESKPKKLFEPFPILLVNAQSTEQPSGPGNKPKQEDKNKDKNYYDCPVYRYPKRNDRYLIIRIPLSCGDGT